MKASNKQTLSLSLSLFLLFSIVMRAQDIGIGVGEPSIPGIDDTIICGMKDDVSELLDNNNSFTVNKETAEGYLTGEPAVVNIFFWGINKDDGTSKNKLSEEDVYYFIAQLNEALNPHNIFIKLLGYDGTSFNSTRFYNSKRNTEKYPSNGSNSTLRQMIAFAKENNNQYFRTDAINAYITNEIFVGSGQAGGYGSNYLWINHFSLRRKIMTHEVGHCFGLFHTFRGWNSPRFCERVTRDPNDLNYNANDYGDKIADTGAISQNILANENCGYLGTRDFNEKGDNTSIQQGMDCDGTPYEVTKADMGNFMSYTTDRCRSQFTTGQAVVMHSKIRSSENLATSVSDVSSLYKPWKGKYNYYYRGPDYQEKVYFQPGFDYHFVKCSTGGTNHEPTAYHDTTFSYDTSESRYYSKDYLGDIRPYNHEAIIIDQIDPDQPRSCYSNNRYPNHGVVTEFNDGTFSPNITEHKKDSLEINSPDLINNLPNGLFSIKKYWLGGYSEERTILKAEDND